MTSLDAIIEEYRSTLPPLLTVNQAENVSTRSSSTIHRAIRAGRLPYNQPTGPGGEIRIPRDELLEWAFRLEVQDAATRPESPRPKRSRSEGRKSPSPRKRRPPLRVVNRGTRAWSEDEMLQFAAGYSG